MGRAITRFKPEIVKAILKDIKRGVPYQIAAEKQGIHESTFRDWRRNGLRDLIEQVDSDYSNLVRSLREIEAERISENLLDIRLSEKGHKGKEWELERSFWKYFSGKAAEIELNERVEALENKKGEEKIEEQKKEKDNN